MAIPKGYKSHREAVWCLHAMRLKIRSSHLTCKVANKCLNFLDGMEVEQRDKNAPLFPCCSVVSAKEKPC